MHHFCPLVQPKKASGITNSKIYYLNGNKNKTELIRPTRVQYPIELIRNSLDLRKRLAKKYANVNNNSPQMNETFYQSAWHGSPYDFELNDAPFLPPRSTKPK